MGTLRRRHADLPRLRLPVPAHRRRRRALVPQPRRAPGRRGPRGHLSDPAPVGPRYRTRRAAASMCGSSGRGCSSTPVPGQRRILPPLVFGAGVLWHLLRHGRRYDVVHTCSFPYFSLLAAALAAPLRRLPPRRRLVRGLEPWLLARVPGPRRRRRRLARAARCARASASAPSASRGCYAQRLRDEGLRGEITMLAGAYDGPLEPRPIACRRAAGRVRRAPHPREARTGDRPGDRRGCAPRCRSCGRVILGDGPDRERGAAPRRASSAWPTSIDVPGLRGHRGGRRDDRAGRCACCCPRGARATAWWWSRRRPHGTPSVVVAGPDNAAVELIDEGENGFVAASDSPEDLAAAIVAVHDGGRGAAGVDARRGSQRNAERMSLEHSLEIVARASTSAQRQRPRGRRPGSRPPSPPS